MEPILTRCTYRGESTLQNDTQFVRFLTAGLALLLFILFWGLLANVDHSWSMFFKYLGVVLTTTVLSALMLTISKWVQAVPIFHWVILTCLIVAAILVAVTSPLDYLFEKEAAAGETDEADDATEDDAQAEPAEDPTPADEPKAAYAGRTITVGSMTLNVPPGPDSDNGVTNLSEAIERGRALLVDTKLLERPGKCMSLKGNPQRCQDVMIAVANGDQLKAVIVQEYSEKYTEDVNGKKMARWRQTWVSSDPAFQIELCGKFNWLNSIWKVTESTSADRWTVVASKYNMKRKGKRVAEVNTPYNAGLDSPEMREAGLRYLAELAQSAQDYLEEHQVPSVYFDGQVSEIYPPSVPVALVLTENTGAVVFDECPTDDCRLRELNNALVRLGANQEQAFRHRNSSASAKGILQITRRTFMGSPSKPKKEPGLQRMYPAAGLPRDFQQVVNHDIGMRAAYVHLDSEMWPVPAARREFYLEHPEPFYQYLAAAYNGSADRISRVITEHGADWRDGNHLCTKRDCESRTYVEKFRFVWDTIFGEGVDPDSLDISAYFAR